MLKTTAAATFSVEVADSLLTEQVNRNASSSPTKSYLQLLLKTRKDLFTYVPLSIISPSWRTRIWSALTIVDNLKGRGFHWS